MTSKKVNRYRCDFCKKSGYSATHMKRHESGCTLNPNRVCRVCKMDRGFVGRGEAVQKPIAELLALLPHHPRDFYPTSYILEPSPCFVDASPIAAEINAALPALRAACGNCPACIMAALRQANIPVPMATDFDWSKEMKAIWDNINDANCGE